METSAEAIDLPRGWRNAFSDDETGRDEIFHNILMNINPTTDLYSIKF